MIILAVPLAIITPRLSGRQQENLVKKMECFKEVGMLLGVTRGGWRSPKRTGIGHT